MFRFRFANNDSHHTYNSGKIIGILPLKTQFIPTLLSLPILYALGARNITSRQHYYLLCPLCSDSCIRAKMGCGSSKKKIASQFPQRKPPSSAQSSQTLVSSGQPLQSSSKGFSTYAAAAGQPLQSSPQQTPSILPSTEQGLQAFARPQSKLSQRVSPPAGESARLLPHDNHSVGPQAARIFEQLSRLT